MFPTQEQLKRAGVRGLVRPQQHHTSSSEIGKFYEHGPPIAPRVLGQPRDGQPSSCFHTLNTGLTGSPPPTGRYAHGELIEGVPLVSADGSAERCTVEFLRGGASAGLLVCWVAPDRTLHHHYELGERHREHSFVGHAFVVWDPAKQLRAAAGNPEEGAPPATVDELAPQSIVCAFRPTAPLAPGQAHEVTLGGKWPTARPRFHDEEYRVIVRAPEV